MLNLLLIPTPDLLLAPATRVNLETSIEKSVDVEFAKKILPAIFMEEILKESEGEGIYCFGMTMGRKSLFDKIKEGDEVLLSEKGKGLFTHFGIVTGKINSKAFGDALWPVRGNNSFENIYFLKSITKRSIQKQMLLNKLGYREGFNLPGPIMVKKDVFQKMGSIRNISDDSVAEIKPKNIMSNKPKIIKVVYKKVEIDAAINGHQIHVVFVADPGPSMYMNHVPDAFGLNYEDAALHANTVNDQNETGTLHPNCSVTIVPLSVFDNRNDIGNREAMRAHIKDVFKANEEYIQLPDIFFCFEPRPDFDYDLAVDFITELGNKTYQYAQRISFL